MILKNDIEKNKILRFNSELHIYYLACTGAVILWSASFIATKMAYDTFAPIQLGEARTILAVIIFWVVKKVKRTNEKIMKEDRMRIAFSGILGITLYFTIENIGVSMTSSSNAALIVASFPVITTLLEFFIYNLRPIARNVFGIILALLGVAVLTQVTIDGNSKSLIGNMLLIGAGVIWAFYNFITRSISNKYSPLTLTYYQMLLGAFFFIPFVLIEGSTWKMPSITSTSALIFLSLGCSVLAFILYNLGLRKLSASVSVSLMNLVPILGLAFSVLILGETVTVIQLLGGIIVIVGVILSSSIQKGSN